MQNGGANLQADSPTARLAVVLRKACLDYILRIPFRRFHKIWQLSMRSTLHFQRTIVDFQIPNFTIAKLFGIKPVSIPRSDTYARWNNSSSSYFESPTFCSVREIISKTEIIVRNKMFAKHMWPLSWSVPFALRHFSLIILTGCWNCAVTCNGVSWLGLNWSKQASLSPAVLGQGRGTPWVKPCKRNVHRQLLASSWTCLDESAHRCHGAG